MTIKAWLLLFGAAAIGLVIFATAFQYRLERAARSWAMTRGRILSAKVVARKVRKIGEQGSEMRNFAEITYEYEARGKMRRSNRVRLGEDIGNTNVAETMARYPEGAPVIAYYDRAKPTESVLERTAPAGVYRTLVTFILFCIAAWLAFAFGTEALYEALAAGIPKPGNAWAVALFGGFGALCALLAFASGREVATTRTWQPTWGRIESAEVDKFKVLSMDADRVWRWFFYPLITYSYTVAGHRYTGSRIALGGSVFASLDLFARRQAAAYRPGDPVEVYFDPSNPSRAVLQRRSAGLGWMWTVGIVSLGLAARAAGVI